nr:MAG TPA: hypothetical protein [Caudoviricetes sp.]
MIFRLLLIPIVERMYTCLVNVVNHLCAYINLLMGK